MYNRDREYLFFDQQILVKMVVVVLVLALAVAVAVAV